MREAFRKSTILFSVCAFLFISLFTNVKFAYAEDNNSIIKKVYIPDNISYTINEGNINLNSSINDEGNFEVHAEMDTKNLDDGYYTAFVYENGNKNWSNYDGISFNVENLGDKSIDLNVDVVSTNQDNYKIAANNVIYIQYDSNKLISQTKAVNNVIRINSDFSGTIIIPFESFAAKDKSKKLNPSEIALWGLDVTIPNDNVVQFVVSDFSLVNFSGNLKTYMNNKFVIHGDSEVTIPNEGEFVYSYNVLKNPSENETESNNFYGNYEDAYKNVKFKIYEDDVKGVSISEKGVLSVNDEANTQTITIVASIEEENFEQGFKVDLVNSYEHGITVNNVSIDIPKIDTLSNDISLIKILMNSKFINMFRIFIIICAIGFGSVIFRWRRRRKLNR